MPLQLKRCGQLVDPLVQQFHHGIVGAIDHYFAGPHRASRFGLHADIGWDDPGSAHPSETFPHAFENPRPIVAPLILIIGTDKIGYSLPVSVFDRVKEIFCVSWDLTLRPPKPDETQSNTKCESQPAIQSSAKRNRYRHDSLPEELHHLAGKDRLFQGRLDRFLYRYVSFPAFILQRDMLDRDRIRISV